MKTQLDESIFMIYLTKCLMQNDQIFINKIEL